MTSISSRLAVCSWSLQPVSVADLVEKTLATGVRRLQLALDPPRENPAAWSDLRGCLDRAGITVVSGMLTTVGEDYSTLETIKRTGGIVPDATWAQNWAHFQAAAALAAQLKLRLVTLHAGFLPHDPADPSYAPLAERLRKVADLFGAQGMSIALETGQETATCLASFLSGLGAANVGVNFDPANMILYDKGEPVAALRTLGRWLSQVHLKDATRTRIPGTWGEEVPVGTGEVAWPAFFQTLRELGYAGDLCLEREAGTQRVADLRSGAAFVARLGG